MPLRANLDLTKSLLSRGSIVRIRRDDLVLALVDQAVRLDPGHHVTQLRADLLDAVRLPDAPHRLQGRRPRAVLQDEFTRELPALDLLENALHLGFGFVVYDARPAREIAVFRS